MNPLVGKRLKLRLRPTTFGMSSAGCEIPPIFFPDWLGRRRQFADKFPDGADGKKI